MVRRSKEARKHPGAMTENLPAVQNVGSLLAPEYPPSARFHVGSSRQPVCDCLTQQLWWDERMSQRHIFLNLRVFIKD